MLWPIIRQSSRSPAKADASTTCSFCRAEAPSPCWNALAC
uniref:YyzF-like protein n=1 Tax=Siphoviridae sp. ctL5G6 TaxID=2826247 RepID=A0A8S5N974_9CAUD|nr:MAG TPA: YyzF-like protein [Siphoviridae sp. ctL5G6]